MKAPKGLLIGILGKKKPGEETDDNSASEMGSVFSSAFSDFKEALDSDDAEAGKDAFKRMYKSCQSKMLSEEEGDDSEEY